MSTTVMQVLPSHPLDLIADAMMEAQNGERERFGFNMSQVETSAPVLDADLYYDVEGMLNTEMVLSEDSMRGMFEVNVDESLPLYSGMRAFAAFVPDPASNFNSPDYPMIVVVDEKGTVVSVYTREESRIRHIEFCRDEDSRVNVIMEHDTDILSEQGRTGYAQQTIVHRKDIVYLNDKEAEVITDYDFHNPEIVQINKPVLLSSQKA